MFSAYLQLGFQHILDLQGYDHILFIITLCAVYRPREWKRILILVTAFTIGHSLTLALAALNVIKVNAQLIEFLIPLTILLTALFNVWTSGQKPRNRQYNYYLASFFGLIHGMGFSNYFRALLGKESDVTGPLFAFNVGVELGQICIVLAFMALAYIFLQSFKVKRRDWVLFVSGAAAGIATILLIESSPW